jgi:4-hydroxybenzoate polyprenyltransferase
VSWLRRARAGRWVHFLALPLAGLDPRLGVASILAVARGVVVAFAVLAFGYLLNALTDRVMDRPAKNPLATGAAPPRTIPVELTVLAGLALVAGVHAPACARIATVVCLASGLLYSAGPRLKRYPLVGSLANVTNFVPLMWVGAADGGAPRGLVPLAAVLGCMLLQNQLIHEAADRQEDHAGGVRTSVIVLGARRASVAAAALGAGVVVGSHVLGVPAWLPAAVYLLAFPAALAAAGADEARMERLRVVHRIVSVVAGAALFILR